MKDEAEEEDADDDAPGFSAAITVKGGAFKGPLNH